MAVRFYQLVAITGPMPAGGTNRVGSRCVRSRPCHEGHAIEGRYKQKTPTTSTTASGTIRRSETLAEECRPLLDHASGEAGYGFIAGKFDTADGFGPTCVRRFVEDTNILGDRSPINGSKTPSAVDARLRALGLRDECYVCCGGYPQTDNPAFSRHRKIQLAARTGMNVILGGGDVGKTTVLEASL